jgi:hypothetical protein
MHLSKEEVHQDSERPQKDIVNPIRHRELLFVLGRGAFFQAARICRGHLCGMLVRYVRQLVGVNRTVGEEGLVRQCGTCFVLVACC